MWIRENGQSIRGMIKVICVIDKYFKNANLKTSTPNNVPIPMRRRNLIQGFFAACAVLTAWPARAASTFTKPSVPKYRKVKWQKLHEEEVGPGDFWASHNCDPNTPELQAGNYEYNLQMQAIHVDHHGTKAKDIRRGNGDYWRPVGITEVF